MALTRRSRLFRAMAESIEAYCQEDGWDISSEIIDLALNTRIETVASGTRVTARTAVGYFPEDLVSILGDQLIAIATEVHGRAVDQPPLADVIEIRSRRRR